MDLEFELEKFPAFVDRKKELDWLTQQFLRNEYKHFPIFISGPAGIGKTTLVQQWFRHLRLSGEPIWVSLYKAATIEQIQKIFLQLKIQTDRFRSTRDEPR